MSVRPLKIFNSYHVLRRRSTSNVLLESLERVKPFTVLFSKGKGCVSLSVVNRLNFFCFYLLSRKGRLPFEVVSGFNLDSSPYIDSAFYKG